MQLFKDFLVLFALFAKVESTERSGLQKHPSLRKQLDAEGFQRLRKQRREQQEQQQQQQEEDDGQQDDTDNDADDNADADSPDSSEPAKSVQVPAAADAVLDGDLPGVSKILDGASDAMKSINSQAMVLQAQLVKKQKQLQELMGKKKILFEGKLKAQDTDNRKAMDQNVKLEAEVQGLERDNAKSRQRGQQLLQGNRQMRGELQTLKSRLGDGRSFADESLSRTDDSWVKELNVLKAGPAHRSSRKLVLIAKLGADDGNDESDADADTTDDVNQDGDGDSEGQSDESFLEVSSKRARVREQEEEDDMPASADPSSVMATLRAGVEQMAKQGWASEHQLFEVFMTSFKVGQKRHQVLLLNQKALTKQRALLQSQQAELRTATAHLEATRAELLQRIRGLGLFVQKLAHLALAPEAEVPHLEGGLPTTVKAVAPPHAAAH